ncbi:GNAT family N-acetyltransferase [Streptomyces sp. NPDC050560]|uniref:GNAT family N-acetyltransferase n=1 Tax=Streptomyces sp. NPDC050560 TaxID=3365630 RepID=UPI0037A9DEEC
MPLLVPLTIAPGSLSGTAQPRLPLAPGALLRPWRLDDAPAVRAAFDDPLIQRWHLLRLDSAPEAEGWVRDCRSTWEREAAAHWAVVTAADDALLGRVALKGWDAWDGSAEIAYWMTPAGRGAGLCTRAVRAVTEWAFRTAGFHRVQIVHSTANVPSCRVATKAGYAWESTRRAAARHLDGWHDMHVHARTADEG